MRRRGAMGKLYNLLNKAETGFSRIKLSLKDKLNRFDTVIAYPYRGYGNSERAVLRGRVLEKNPLIHGDADPALPGFWSNFQVAWARFESDEVPRVRVEGILGGSRAEAVSDDEGFFTLRFDLTGLDPSSGWHDVDLRIVDTPYEFEFEESTRGEVLIEAGEDGSFGIISDVDDTILESHIVQRIRMIMTLLRYSYQERVPFEHVEELYEALSDGGRNPLFFVSGSSYNLYDFLERFCAYHRIPKAPFFLREFGITGDYFLHEKSEKFKRNRINALLETYPDLPFVLIGDSGEKDPEIYSRIHEEHPGRIRQIYIRNVSGLQRKLEIEGLADKTGASMLVVKDSRHALEHARSQDWIRREALTTT